MGNRCDTFGASLRFVRWANGIEVCFPVAHLFEESLDHSKSPVSTHAMDVAAPPPYLRRNFIFLVLDAALFSFAISFVDWTSVLPSLLGHVTQQPVLLGLIGSVQTGCWLLPQLFSARIVAGRKHKLPMVVFGTAISRLGWSILLTALIFYDRLSPVVIMITCYLALGIFTSMDGVSALGWYDLIARTIPASLRGRLLGSMTLCGGLLASIGGYLVQRIIGNPRLPYPADYRLMVSLTLLLLTVGIIPLMLVKEIAEEDPKPPEPLGRFVRQLPGLLRDRQSFRRLVAVQILIGTSSFAVPFYTPYAVLSLHLPEAIVGTFVIGVTVGQMIGGGTWGYLGDLGHKRTAIRLIACCAFLAPAIPASLRFVPFPLPTFVAIGAIACSYFFIGCSVRASWVAYTNYVIEIANPRERPVLIGLMNTLSGILAILAPLGGLLASTFGYSATFAVAALPATLGLVLSFRLAVPETVASHG